MWLLYVGVVGALPVFRCGEVCVCLCVDSDYDRGKPGQELECCTWGVMNCVCIGVACRICADSPQSRTGCPSGVWCELYAVLRGVACVAGWCCDMGAVVTVLVFLHSVCRKGVC